MCWRDVVFYHAYYEWNPIFLFAFQEVIFSENLLNIVRWDFQLNVKRMSVKEKWSHKEI